VVDELRDKPRPEVFRMRIDACFTISGRGTVVSGEVLAGGIGKGDQVTIVHAGHETRVTCAGVQSIRVRQDAPGVPSYPPIGLLVPGLDKFDPVEGDCAVIQ
jgi:translation elongation factor EF-Tu-like GTPase